MPACRFLLMLLHLLLYRSLRRININLIFNNLRCQCKLTVSEYLFNIYLIRGFDLESILYCSLRRCETGDRHAEW